MAIKTYVGNKYFVVGQDNICTESNNKEWIGLDSEVILEQVRKEQKAAAYVGLFFMILFWSSILTWVIFGRS